MRFGPLPVDKAEGTILAHSIEVEGRKLRKAHVLDAVDIAALNRAKIANVVAVVLDPDDVGENEAAQAIVSTFAAPGVVSKLPATGRVNLHAEEAGLFDADAGLIDAINDVDPRITIATLPRFATVEAGQMVATVKIIPYAVPGDIVDRVKELCRNRFVIRVDAFRSLRIGLVQTELPGVKGTVLDKTTNITRTRLARSGSRVGHELRVGHEPGSVAKALETLEPDHDLLIVFGASAVSDDADVIPEAIRRSGGTVLRTGMPVDPGNLLVLGEISGKTVIGAPGCARSPKENGFDWVLDRVLAGHDVRSKDIAAMGVGGLLMEIAGRPQPRDADATKRDANVHAVVLAAGRSSRMGGPNKLLASFDGTPLIRRTVDEVLASKASGVVTVLGHQAARVISALSGARIVSVENPCFAEGLSSSLKAGVAALPSSAGGALVVLGDMPGVGSGDLNRMIDAFRRAQGRAVVRATHNGKRGNPVILPRSLFAKVGDLRGDTGARHLIESADFEVIDIELGEAASVDVDTPEAMARAGGILQG